MAAGRIELYLGPMFSGKTERVLGIAQRATYADMRVCVVRHSRDNRPSEAGEPAQASAVVSHGGRRLATSPADEARTAVRVVAAAELADVHLADDERTVAVDEGQFFDDLARACVHWAEQGRRVVVAALDGDFEGRPFAPVVQLLPECEVVEKLNGVCMRCRRAPSAFSVRTVASRERVLIGGREMYAAVCRACRRQPATGPPSAD